MRICRERELEEEVSLVEELSLMTVWCGRVRLPIPSFDPGRISRLRMLMMQDYLGLWKSRPSPLWMSSVSFGWSGI